MTGCVRWSDIREQAVERAGGAEAFEEGERRILAEARGFRLAEPRRSRGLAQQRIADRVGVTKGRVSQIENGSVSGRETLARHADSLAGTLQQSIFFEDGDIARIA